MPVPWLAVLQSVPWVDVIRNAPRIADGAKKLWSTVSRSPAGKVESRVAGQQAEPLSPEALQARLLQAEQQIDALHVQMLASSELIKALAEQNTEMATGLAVFRRRFYWLGMISLAALSISCIAIIMLFSNR